MKENGMEGTRTCAGCGGEVVDLGLELSDGEVADIELCRTKGACARAALRPDALAGIGFDDPAELYAYVKANTDILAEAIMLEYMWRRRIGEKHGISGTQFFPEGNRLLAHRREADHGNAR